MTHTRRAVSENYGPLKWLASDWFPCKTIQKASDILRDRSTVADGNSQNRVSPSVRAGFLVALLGKPTQKAAHDKCGLQESPNLEVHFLSMQSNTKLLLDMCMPKNANYPGSLKDTDWDMLPLAPRIMWGTFKGEMVPPCNVFLKAICFL